MKIPRLVVVLIVIILVSAIGLYYTKNKLGPQNEGKLGELSVAISPYQDIAMLVNAGPLGLDKKYGVNLVLKTLSWEEILPAVASAGTSVDVGFIGLAEYLTKEQHLNPPDTSDPVLFIYPVYVYKGGAFITFNESVPTLDRDKLGQPDAVKSFFQFRIGAQKNSIYEMMLYSLAKRNGIPLSNLKITDTPLNDGILAVQANSLDISSAGLTQLTEAKKRGGHAVLTMDDLGFADVMGFMAKKSVIDKKRKEIESLIKIWFECTDWVLSDIDKNSVHSLAYLEKNASTKYSLNQYKEALSQEFFPRNLKEVNETLASANGNFSYKRTSEDIGAYLVATKIVVTQPKVPEILQLRP